MYSLVIWNNILSQPNLIKLEYINNIYIGMNNGNNYNIKEEWSTGKSYKWLNGKIDIYSDPETNNLYHIYNTDNKRNIHENDDLEVKRDNKRRKI